MKSEVILDKVYQNIHTSVLKMVIKPTFSQKEVVHCYYAEYSLQNENVFDTNVKTTSQKMVTVGN
jgi:hypothetical protein